MGQAKTLSQRIQEFISVILAIWVADGLVKQVSFLSGLNNLFGLILVSAIVYLLVDYSVEFLMKKKGK